jgi:hypothetical protein
VRCSFKTVIVNTKETATRAKWTARICSTKSFDRAVGDTGDAEGTSEVGDAGDIGDAEGISEVGDAGDTGDAEGTSEVGDAEDTGDAEGISEVGDAGDTGDAEGISEVGDAGDIGDAEGISEVGDAGDTGCMFALRVVSLLEYTSFLIHRPREILPGCCRCEGRRSSGYGGRAGTSGT